jgi:hypothetical protein
MWKCVVGPGALSHRIACLVGRRAGERRLTKQATGKPNPAPWIGADHPGHHQGRGREARLGRTARRQDQTLAYAERDLTSIAARGTMPGKIFVSYRRHAVRDTADRIRDRLVASRARENGQGLLHDLGKTEPDVHACLRGQRASILHSAEGPAL